MPRCVDCGNFNVKDGYCAWHNAYIKESSAKKSMRCNGYIPAEKHYCLPDYKLVRRFHANAEPKPM
jgi:hypothetical protein